MMRARYTAIALAVALLLGGCTATAETSSPSSTSTTVSPARAAIEATVANINHTAGGTVDAQRAVLNQVASPTQVEAQRACPKATTTLAFDPAYSGLRKVGDEYLLPTYITIYTGGRITGSDLATLHLWIVDGMARTSALCVS